MQTIAGTMRRLPVKGTDGSIDLIEMDAIFYLEARGGRHAGPDPEKKTLPFRSAAECACPQAPGPGVCALPSRIRGQFEPGTIAHTAEIQGLRPAARSSGESRITGIQLGRHAAK